MSATKVLVIGGLGVGLALLFMHAKSASASPKFPPGWTPPAGATTTVLGADMQAKVGFPVARTDWTVAADAGGTQAGTYHLFQNTNAPDTDYVVMFVNQASGASAPLAIGPSANAKLLAQAVVAGV